MNLKKVICRSTISALFLTAAGFPLLHAGIGDLIKTTLTPEVRTEPPKVRVLLLHDQPTVAIEVKGKYKIYDPRTNEQVSMNFQGKRRLMRAEEDGIRWGEEFPGIHQLVIVPDISASTIVVAGIEYQGTIYVYDVGGTLSVVNKIDAEDYLKAILPKRYPSTVVLPEEFLAAIAIVARTQNYANVQSNKYWDVDAAKEGYGGYALARGSKAVENAITKTQYLALQEQEQGKGPFLPDWSPVDGKRYQGTTYSLISLDEAQKMAENGKNAVDILKKAFPDASLQLAYKRSDGAPVKAN
jgi:stage II sporulation protein D